MTRLLDRDVSLGDRVIITDGSINCGDLHGRRATLIEITDDDDGYDYHVNITDLIGLTTFNDRRYEVWVRDVAPIDTNIGLHPSVED